MNNPTTEQVQKRFNQLPKVTQDTLYSVDTANAVGIISKTLQLSNEQVSKLADEVGLVLLGFTRESEFVTHLIERLRISKEAAEQIILAIENKIFSKLKKELKEERTNETEEFPNNVKQIHTKEKPLPTSTKTEDAASQKIQKIKSLANTQQTKELLPSPTSKEKTRPYSIDPYRESIN